MEVFDVLKTLATAGVKLQVVNGKLNVKARPGLLTDDLKKLIVGHKTEIISIISNIGIDLKAGAPDKKDYYEITPLQHWWVNDANQDFKSKMHGLFTYRIEGDLNLDAISNAVAFVIRRHDSLRSAFYSSDGKYVMRVLNETTEGFQLKFYNASNPNVSKEALKRFLAFEDHEFNVSQGPLFCTRLARLSEVEHILVMKLHHVIFDTWSLAVLQRDLLVAYAAFNSGEKPNLPELKFQYGDYMCLDNQYRENNLIRDKSYWQKRYTMLPKELILRGEKKRKALDVGLRFCKRIVFTMPTESYAKIIRWSRKHSASLFIVMIAALKSYLGKVTGQNDIILGTQVFGRENHVGLESQIGFYSRMNLLRTVLPEHNTIDRAITSAKKSYEEMQVHTAFSLMDHIEAMLPEGQHITGTFWKINVQYEDAHGYIDQTAMPTLPGLQITQIREDNPLKLHNIDLRFDFFNQNGKIQIAVDYNVDLYDEQLIRTFIEGYFMYAGHNE